MPRVRRPRLLRALCGEFEDVFVSRWYEHHLIEQEVSRQALKVD